MKKGKYRYNPESLSYVKIKLSIKDKLLYFATYLLASLLIGFVFNVAFTSIFDSPKEKKLRRENRQLLLQYEMLDKKLDQANNVLTDIQQRDDNIYRTIFEAEPIPQSVRQAGFGGVNRYADLENLDNSEIVIETTKKLDKLSKQLVIQSRSYDEVIKLARNKEAMLSAIPAIQPISNKDLTRTASGWGYRIHPIYKIKKFHYGMDFTASTGTEVYATGDGVISELESSKRGYGNHLVINHGFGYSTRYAHMNRFAVKQGQSVKRGDIIGYVGSTGLSTGPHLHYEVELNGEKVNPVNYYFNDLSPEEFDKMIDLSLNASQTFD